MRVLIYYLTLYRLREDIRMPVNQPPINRDDPIRSSWDLETTQLVNRLEQEILELRGALEALQARVTRLENP